MNICVLEHPRVRSEEKFNDIANTPLWSCLMGGYAAAVLKAAGHDVILMDTTVTGWDFEKTGNEILLQSPDMLCVNAVYFWEHTGRLFDFLSDLKAEGFNGHISLFGFYPTLAYGMILENVPSIDSIVVGECENILKDLAHAISEKQDISHIPGIAVRASKGVALSSHVPPVQDLNAFPFPERVSVSDQTAGILASRGCYNHCVFCPVPAFYNQGALWRGRSPENVFQEMSRLTDMGVRDFYFVDPNFIGPGRSGKKRIHDLMDMIRPMGISFGMETRPNDLDPTLFDQMVSAGLKSLLMGIESGSVTVLGGLNKGASIDSSEKAIRICRAAGIEPEVGFLMFVPDSTLEDLGVNFAFLRKNNLLDRLERTANLLGHRQIVMMGTSGYNLYCKQKRLSPAGIFGFEGHVTYRDQRVYWMSHIMIHACLSVLRIMERPDSPIYWQSCGHGEPDSMVAARVNQYLVALFERLLVEARKTSFISKVDEMKKDVSVELAGVLTDM